MTSQNEVFAGRQFPAGDAKASLTEWRAQAEPEQDTAQIATSPQRAEDVAPEVFIEQIRLLYQHPVLILANIVNAALVVAVLWSSFPHPALLAWLALFLVLTPLRLLVWHLQARHRWPAAHAATWSVVGSALTGGVWGLLAFAIVSGGVWVLRRRNPDLPRPFKTPMVPVVSTLGIAFSLWWMYNLPGVTWLRLVIWLIIGMFIYFGYGRKHSRVQQGAV